MLYVYIIRTGAKSIFLQVGKVFSLLLGCKRGELLMKQLKLSN